MKHKKAPTEPNIFQILIHQGRTVADIYFNTTHILDALNSGHISIPSMGAAFYQHLFIGPLWITSMNEFQRRFWQLPL